MICAACQATDADLEITPEQVNFTLSGELPREAFLLHGVLNGGMRRHAAVCDPWRCTRRGTVRVCELRTYGCCIGARLAPFQAPGGITNTISNLVGTSGGTETVARALAAVLGSAC